MAKKEVKGKDKAIDMLLENSIALQKTITSLATELKSLNKKVSSLLALFEDASKSFKEAKIQGLSAAPSVASEKVLEKIDELAKQNKTIARGLILLEKSVRKEETRIRPRKTRQMIEEPKKEEFEEEAEEEPEEEAEEEEEPEEEEEAEPLPEFTF